MSDIVSTTSTTYPITLAEVKRHLNVSTTYDDTYIDECIEAATQYVEDRTHQSFINETRTLKMRGFYDPRYTHDDSQDRTKIYPPRGPVSSVSSIVYQASADGTNTTLSSTAYSVSSDNPSKITEAYNNTWPDTRDVEDSVTITYVAGHGSTQGNVPTSIRHALKLLVGHWYRNRETVVVGTITKEMELGMDSLLQHEHLEHYG